MAGRYGRTHKINVTPTITGGAYSAADVVGGLIRFDTLATGGDIIQVNIYDKDNEKAAGRLWFFDERPAPVTDNAAFAIADAELYKIIGWLDVAAADYNSIGSTGAVAPIPVTNSDDFKALAYTGRDVYMYFVCTATPTYAATNDLVFSLIVWPNN